MRLPWRRDRDRLDRARREQAEIKEKGKDREPMLRRQEKRLHSNGFADAIRVALGGRP